MWQAGQSVAVGEKVPFGIAFKGRQLAAKVVGTWLRDVADGNAEFDGWGRSVSGEPGSKIQNSERTKCAYQSRSNCLMTAFPPFARVHLNTPSHPKSNAGQSASVRSVEAVMRVGEVVLALEVRGRLLPQCRPLARIVGCVRKPLEFYTRKCSRRCGRISRVTVVRNDRGRACIV